MFLDAELCIVFINASPPLPSLSSQPVLRAPLSPSRGEDCVSSVRSTAAPPSRRPPSAAAGTASTAATWTDLRTCAPVSPSVSLSNKDTHIHTNKHKHNKPVNSAVRCDSASGRPIQVHELMIFGLKLPISVVLELINRPCHGSILNNPKKKNQYLCLISDSNSNSVRLVQSMCRSAPLPPPPSALVWGIWEQ